jgi:hypothetical protein
VIHHFTVVIYLTDSLQPTSGHQVHLLLSHLLFLLVLHHRVSVISEVVLNREGDEPTVMGGSLTT